MGWLDWFLGQSDQAPQQRQPTPPHTPTPATAYETTIPAPPLTQYPTSADATAARAGGFGYGEPYSAYIEGLAGRIYGDKQGPTRMEGRGGLSPFALIDYNRAAQEIQKTPTTQNVPSPYKEQLQDNLTRAALAAQHSPVAAVGFDPRHITTDVTGKSNVPALGLTSPQAPYPITSTSAPPGNRNEAYSASTVLHESMHRGLMQLMENPQLRKLIPQYLRDRMDPYNTADHEALVYQLMARQAGDPDTPAGSGERKFAGAQWTDEEIEVLNKAAQEAIRLRRPYGGPR